VTQVRLAANHNMVETFTPDRTDHALHVPVLPWRADGCGMIPDAHTPEPSPENTSIGAIVIPNQGRRRGVPRECFNDLTREPLGRWMAGDGKVHDGATGMPQDYEHEQEFEADRRNDQEVSGGYTIGMIV
jgi:hypothetical protein